jgi:tetratricopeptide (TPR) repeat protein
MENEDMREYLESRIKDNPKSLFFAHLADFYLAQGRIDEAIALCSEGVKHHPYYSTGYFVLAKAHLLKKEYDKAEAELKKVLSHDQQYLAAHKLLGDILMKNGWETTAVQHYGAVLEIDPMEEKVRGMLKRYAPKPVPKSVPVESVESKEEPTAAKETVPGEPIIETKIQPVTETESDWTDQIKEFNPEENGLPLPTATEPAESESRAIAEPSGPQTAETSAEPPIQKDEIIDFTQDWFDLASSETPEDQGKSEAEKTEPQLEIVEASAAKTEEPEIESDFTSLFEKEEPKEVLAPSGLTTEASVPTPKFEKPKPLKAVPPMPKTEKPEASKSTTPPAQSKPPESKTQKSEKPVPPPKPVESVSTLKSEEMAEGKIVTSTLGEIYAVQGQFEKAIRVYEALLEKFPHEQKYIDKIAELKKKMKEASGK